MFYPTLKYSHSITFDHTKVPADVINMPVILTAAQFNTDIQTLNGSQSPRSDGGDIRFFSDSTLSTPLPFDLITFSPNATPANAVIEVTVNVTGMSSSVDTVIYVGWGDATLTGLPASDTYGQNNAYKAGYILWCPMKDDPDTSHIKDRTFYGLSGSKQGAGNPAQGTSAGQINQYESFVNANSSYVQFPAISTGSAFVVFVPFKFTGAAGHGYQRIVSNKTIYSGTVGFEINLITGSNTGLQVLGSSSTEYDPNVFTSLTGDGWETLAVHIYGTNVDVFVNTTKTSGGVITSVANTTNLLTIGNNSSLNEAILDANIDMVLIFSGNLSDGEIQAMQNNQRSPSTFIKTVGATTNMGNWFLLQSMNELYANNINTINR